MKLISMTDYVLTYEYLSNKPIGMQRDDKLMAIERYAQFLKTPLELGMFIPCDEEGNVIDEPKVTDKKYTPESSVVYRFIEEAYKLDLKKYKKAKDRVIFERFIFIKALTAFGESEYYRFMYEETIITNLDFKNKTVEDLIEKYSITLTQNAIKKYRI